MRKVDNAFERHSWAAKCCKGYLRVSARNVLWVVQLVLYYTLHYLWTIYGHMVVLCIIAMYIGVHCTHFLVGGQKQWRLSGLLKATNRYSALLIDSSVLLSHLNTCIMCIIYIHVAYYMMVYCNATKRYINAQYAQWYALMMCIDDRQWCILSWHRDIMLDHAWFHKCHYIWMMLIDMLYLMTFLSFMWKHTRSDIMSGCQTWFTCAYYSSIYAPNM